MMIRWVVGCPPSGGVPPLGLVVVIFFADVESQADDSSGP